MRGLRVADLGLGTLALGDIAKQQQPALHLLVVIDDRSRRAVDVDVTVADIGAGRPR